MTMTINITTETLCKSIHRVWRHANAWHSWLYVDSQLNGMWHLILNSSEINNVSMELLDDIETLINIAQYHAQNNVGDTM